MSRLLNWNLSEKAKHYIILGFLGCIIFLGLLLRTQGLFTNNILFVHDNGRDMLFVKKIVVDHKLSLIGPWTGLQGFFHGVFWYYLLAIPFILGKGNPAVVTGFMALLSTSSILLAFITLKRIAGTFAGFFAAIIYTVAPFSIVTSAWSWNPYPIVWIMPLYAFLLYSFVQKKRYALYGIAFLTALIMQFEIMYGITLVPTLLFLLFVAAKREKIRIKRVKTLLIAGGIFMLPFLPMLLFNIRHNFLMFNANFKSLLSGGATVTDSASQQLLSLLVRINVRGHDLFLYTVQSLTKNSLINIALFILLLFGIFQIINKRQRKERFFILLCGITLLAPLIIFPVLNYPIWNYFWIGSAGLYTFCVAFVLGYLLKKRETLQKVGYILLFIFLLFLIPYEKLFQWSRGAPTLGVQALSLQLDVVNTIYRDAGNKPFSVYVQTPPIYDYAYRYLFWWQGNIHHYQLPNDQKQPLTYFILETTPTKPDGTYFKHNVIKTRNMPVQTFRFPGVTVEKILTASDEASVDSNYFPPL